MGVRTGSMGFVGLRLGACLVLVLTAARPGFAALPQMNFLGTVTAKDDGTGLITVETDHCSGCGCGEAWSECAATLAGTAPNADAWDAVDVGDHVEGALYGCGCDVASPLEWASLGVLLSGDEQLLTDVFGDPSYLVSPLWGDLSLTFRGEPDCATCGCGKCTAKASEVTVGSGTERLESGESAVFEGAEWRTTVVFHSGDAPAKPSCTDADPCPGPQLYSNFTIHIEPAQEAQFSRGNANADGSVNISDGIYLLTYLFLGGKAPPCLDSADTDDSGSLDISDAVGLFNYLFLGAGPPGDPFPACGPDPSPDDLTCAEFPSCH